MILLFFIYWWYFLFGRKFDIYMRSWCKSHNLSLANIKCKYENYHWLHIVRVTSVIWSNIMFDERSTTCPYNRCRLTFALISVKINKAFQHFLVRVIRDLVDISWSNWLLHWCIDFELLMRMVFHNNWWKLNKSIIVCQCGFWNVDQ